MSSRQDQEPSRSYMDSVRVKISEKYKPPPRINLAMSYAQRLTLNKQIQDTIPQYEFLLEKTVVEKMKEWRNARNAMFQQLSDRLNAAKNDEKVKREEYRVKDDDDDVVSTLKPLYSTSDPSQSMLLPTNSFSTILTPVPLKNHTASGQNLDYKASDKSPFNISDFDPDTSSPFDNMELKSINDMEELAQVLKSEQKPKSQSNYNVQTQNSNSSGYSMIGPSYASSGFVRPTVSSLYSTTNGYYYPQETSQGFNSTTYNYPSYGCSPVRDIQVKSIPDIMKTLQNELEHTHVDNTRNARAALKIKSAENFSKARVKNEETFDEFNSLPKSMQDMSKSISLMGFPLSRVARVCKILGNDQKKVVEHLLAMSDLLDLGFPESSVSKALLQCDNDRDKALDILIS